MDERTWIPTSNPAFFLYRVQPVREECVQIVEYLRLLGEHQKTPMTDDPEAVRALIAAEKCEAYFAIYGGRPIGLCVVSEFTALCAGMTGLYMEGFYIEEAYQGRGFGRIFMAFLAKRTLAQGHGRFQWFLMEGNETGMGFYRSLGCQPAPGLLTLRMQGEPLRALAAEFAGPTEAPAADAGR